MERGKRGRALGGAACRRVSTRLQSRNNLRRQLMRASKPCIAPIVSCLFFGVTRRPGKRARKTDTFLARAVHGEKNRVPKKRANLDRSGEDSNNDEHREEGDEEEEEGKAERARRKQKTTTRKKVAGKGSVEKTKRARGKRRPGSRERERK